MFDDCLIMAGGSGVRLWPASSSKRPKQFLPMSHNAGETFFSAALERAFSVVDADGGRVIIIAGRSHVPFVTAACAVLGAAEKKRLTLIPEPEAKNTAPAIACAVAYAGKTAADSRAMLVLTSDHIIKPLERFKADAAAAADFARQGRLAVFGIPPARPETGYGYIETGKRLTTAGVYAVAAFREKPDRAAAEQFAASKRFFWNSGMFGFTAGFLAGEFRRLAPEVFRPFERLTAPDTTSYTKTRGLRILDKWAGLGNAYRRTKSISFDYAVAEQCADTVMVRAGFDWIDIGNWEEYAKLLGGAGGEVYSASCDGCFVDSDIPVALAGVDDLIVVIRSGKNGGPPAALITKKGETQRVRDVVEQIRTAGGTELL
jgi:mannose-1-phosphate guanylyltransferase/mannose-1-phosphate guanylyltransferase/mannose-6-phosphate isomerase